MVFQMLLNTFFYPFYIFIDLLSHVNIIYICIFKELAYSKRVFFIQRVDWAAFHVTIFRPFICNSYNPDLNKKLCS